MSKAVLISIRPRWCQKIVNGEKTIEVRKNRPKLATPFKCYIYETRGLVEKDGTITFRLGGTVIGEFVCDTYVTDKTFGHDALFNAAACMDEDDAADYANGSPLYGWHISDLVIYDEPKELGEYRRVCIDDLYCDSCAMYWNNGGNCGNESLRLKRPPQSWCYVQEVE